ncbi:MAG: acyl-CoA dehydrogenase family protein [Desulfobacula sp.]|jgi:butyryl-CoA dehydrogenase|nr:acyl-CoA dehydrogenase family protein [Desulfobacula sp.]
MIDSLLSTENKMFRDEVRRFANREIAPHVRTWEKEGKYPDSYYKKIAEMGFMGLLVPEEYGGEGGSMIDLAILCEEMGRVGVSIPLTHVSACCRSIAHLGNEDQKKRYLPDMASGKKIGAYCQTEANAGSDAGNLASFAEDKDNHYLLNGEKIFISNAKIAKVLIVLAKTKIVPEKPSKGIAMFIVDSDSPGVSIGRSEKMMGRNCSSLDEIIFKDVKIPKENLLIPAGGKGFKEIMKEFNSERCGNSSFCVGFAQGAYERTLKYCKERIEREHSNLWEIVDF